MIPAKHVLFVIAAGLALSACTQSALRLSPDFSNSVRQNVAAQIADPDAHYEGKPAPGSSGPRAALAGARYDANEVIPPSAITASSNRSIGNADNGYGGSSPGAGSSVGASAGMSR